MINCKYYAINERVFFSTVANEKQDRFKTVLNRISGRVLGSYDTYLNDFSAICRKPVSEFDALTESEERRTLKLCYSSATLSFKYFTAEIITRQPHALQSLCPYCMIDRPRTLDHYVGQAEFPEFSILTKNLIPCCWNCNHVKRAAWRAGGTRQYINFYDDAFLEFPFLIADLIVIPGNLIPAISFRLVRPPEIGRQEFAIIESHFDSLDLLVQYSRKANSRISTEIATIGTYIDRELEDETIRDIIFSRFTGFAGGFGVNYWEAVVYRTLADNLPIIRRMF